MTVLDEIIAHKRTEVDSRKELYPVKLLEKSIYFATPCVKLTKYLLRQDRVGIIAEIKRKSPSKGVLNEYVSVEKLSLGYMQAGASAISVLTDSKYFGGKNEDLTIARRVNYCPILRKDFIIDEYQILEAKSLGADVVLLIAAALPVDQVSSLAQFAHTLGLEVLLEVHSEEELAACSGCEVDLIGVNNRNLADFTVDVQRSFELVDKIPSHTIKISESGITDAGVIKRLREAGYRGFLVGEAFMRTPYPERACRDLIEGISLSDDR